LPDSTLITLQGRRGCATGSSRNSSSGTKTSGRTTIALVPISPPEGGPECPRIFEWLNSGVSFFSYSPTPEVTEVDEATEVEDDNIDDNVDVDGDGDGDVFIEAMEGLDESTPSMFNTHLHSRPPSPTMVCTPHQATLPAFAPP